MAELKITDDQYVAKWVAMLNIFKSLIKDSPSVKDVKDDLMELRNEAIQNPHLTPNQQMGIIARCDNYLNGTYGKNLSIIQPDKK